MMRVESFSDHDEYIELLFWEFSDQSVSASRNTTTYIRMEIR